MRISPLRSRQRAALALLLVLIGSDVTRSTAPASVAMFEELHGLHGSIITAASADGTAVAGVGEGVGQDGLFSRAFRWDGAGPVQWLEHTTVRAISADGRVVLVERQNPERVYRWLPDGPLLPITDMPGSLAINDDGSAIAGFVSQGFTRGGQADSSVGAPDVGALFLWTERDGYRLLTLPKGVRDAEPAYFSDDGHTLYGRGAREGWDRVLVRWQDGEPIEAPLTPLIQTAYDWQAYLLPLAEADTLDLRYPNPGVSGGGESMFIEWVSADRDVILGIGSWIGTPMIWTRANGACRLTDWLNALGVTYPRDAYLQGLLTSRDGRMLFGRKRNLALTDDTPWRIVAPTPLGQIRVSSSPYCGGSLKEAEG